MSSRAPCISALALCCSILLGSGDAAAQTDTVRRANDPKATAETLFEEGVALGEAGRWRQACDKLEASETLDVAVGTLLRLGDCYERIGRLTSAWASFREARSLAQTQAMPDRERMAALRAAALDSKIARVTVSVPALAPPGFEVDLAGLPLPRASWGSPVPLDAGNVVVEARAPGHITYRRTLTIPQNDGARLSVVIPELEAVPAPPPPSSAPPPSAQLARPRRAAPKDADTGYAARALGVTFAVVGGVGLATGGVLAVLSSSRNDDSLSECPNGPRLCSARGVQLREEAASLADMATVSTAVGGGLLVTGLVVYVVGSSQSPKERVALQLLPDLQQGGASVRARGTF